MSDQAIIKTTIDRALHTVLVVDDNPVTRYSTARVIRAAGFRTREAATGNEALAMAGDGISAVVLDVHLPDIDGFEVCRHIRDRMDTALLPVIHLSAAYVQNEDKVTGLNAGADAYLIHPVEPAVLTATLQALIRARMAEDRLRRSETRFRAIYDQARSGIALIDTAGCFVDVNPALVELLGRPPQDLVSRPVSAFAPPDWQALVAEKTGGVPDGEGSGDSEPRETASSWQGEFPLCRPDGSWVHLEWSLSAHVEPGLRIGIALDVSDRVLLDQRRQELLEREQAARVVAERHSRTKDDFVAVLSHELRTPLNAIVGWVHVLTRRGGTPEMLKGLEAIDRNVKAQARIISDILDVSRIASGKLQLDRAPTDPAELVITSLTSLRGAVDAKRLVVELNVSTAHASAWLDPVRFQQIFWNLMTNAIKFSSPEGIVKVTLRRNGDTLSLAVQDFGLGIAHGFIDQLFHRFTQSDAPGNRTHGGLGLGLSIVKHLAELHGGAVTARSDGLGHGACMEVSLQVALPAEAGTVGQAGAGNADRPLEGANILVVEDDEDAREMLSVVLTDRGASVRLAADFDAALQALDDVRPDVFVSDIGLPGRDGYELMRQVRQTERAGEQDRLPAIALTAFSRAEDRAKALESGFDTHLSKPLEPHLLVDTIVQLLRRPPGP